MYQGLESEPPDAAKLYWEPNGNIYNPDPFQISPNGPQGTGGGGGNDFPRSLGRPGGGFSGTNRTSRDVGLGLLGADLSLPALGLDTAGNPYAGAALLAFVILDQFFDFDGGNTLEIPRYNIEHTQRGVHPVLPETTHISADWFVTQQSAAAGSSQAGPGIYHVAPNGQVFKTPPGADLCSEYKAGQRNGKNLSAMGKAIGQGGTFDYQRWGGHFNGQYTNASNFGVGVYANGAGYSMTEMNTLGRTYSLFRSSNALSSSQIDWWDQGWLAAQQGVCH